MAHSICLAEQPFVGVLLSWGDHLTPTTSISSSLEGTVSGHSLNVREK